MATLTITTTAAQDTRIIAAFRDRLGPDATAADVKAWLIEQLKAAVHNYETRLAAEAAVSGVIPIEPS